MMSKKKDRLQLSEFQGSSTKSLIIFPNKAVPFIHYFALRVLLNLLARRFFLNFLNFMLEYTQLTML